MAATAVTKKWKNRHISAMAWPIAAKFDKVMHFGGLDPSHPKISTFWKTKMVAAAILKNKKIVISHQLFDRSLWNLAWWHILYLLTPPTLKNSKFWKSKMTAAAVTKKIKSSYISSTVWPITAKFDTVMHSGKLTHVFPTSSSIFDLSKIHGGAQPPCLH